MQTFICPECGQERTGKRKRCYACHPGSPPTGKRWTRRPETIMHRPQSPEVRERISQTLKGVKHGDERVRNIREGVQQARAEGRYRRDPGSHTRGKPSPKRRPAGSERVVKDGRVQVKCEDGKWRYRSRLVWAAANGPIPPGVLIHHDNENPLDDRPENLLPVTRAEHARIHSTPEKMRAAQLLGVAARKRNRNGVS